jgi:hypothetical protein
MPTNETFIMLGLGAAALWFLNRGGSEEDQVDQLAGAAMMASGEGTASDAPFQAYGAPSNPSFFFNQGGQMAKVTERSDGAADKPPYTQPELEFQIDRSNPPVGTTDISPTTPQFAGTTTLYAAPSTIWNDQAAIAEANLMPLLAISDTQGGGVKILGSNVDISTLSSKEYFRAVNLDTGFAFTTTGSVLGEYVRGFIDSTPDSQPITANISAAQSTDEDIGVYPGGGNQGELEFTVARSNPPLGTSDISPTTPQFSSPSASGGNVTSSTIWDQAVLFGDPGPGKAVQTGITSNIKSTVRPEPAFAVDQWWDEG